MRFGYILNTIWTMQTTSTRSPLNPRPQQSLRAMRCLQETRRRALMTVPPQRITPLDFTRPLVPEEDSTRGFTLSYLRRVPELSLMAKRVVKAEAKRRARDAYKRAKAAKEGGVCKKPAVVTQAMVNDQQKLHPRMKRLFSWAILQLVKEGTVISWDGLVRPCPAPGETYDDTNPDSSALWKINSSTASTAGGNSTMFSSASIAEDDEDEGELTDPEPGEEAFVSLTPSFLATTVEKAIGKLVAQATARAQAKTDPGRARFRAPAAGPTCAGDCVVSEE
ncbi:hypothetical protein MVEN_02453900 [Mycena venus]|uniref:Uncharacterized protein n=1 Tax=Mycena venus TaxID=2733690 RepID=A0A8H6WX07_9AGAR|nr:hypothetical protein MVEN_02453900 [Mycena venus]